MGTITINGRTFRGNNVSIVGGRVTIDGVAQEGEQLSGVVEVRVTEGTIGHLTSDASVTCGEVRGNVTAGGSVQCDGVGGSINAGGSVQCGAVGGPVNVGGSIRHR